MSWSERRPELSQRTRPTPWEKQLFIGNDPAKMASQHSSVARLRYERIIPHDLVYYGNQGRLGIRLRKLTVATGTNPKQVVFLKISGSPQSENRFGW